MFAPLPKVFCVALEHFYDHEFFLGPTKPTFGPWYEMTYLKIQKTVKGFMFWNKTMSKGKLLLSCSRFIILCSVYKTQLLFVLCELNWDIFESDSCFP